MKVSASLRDAALRKRSARPALALLTGLTFLGVGVTSGAQQESDFTPTHTKVLKYQDSSDLTDPIAQFQKKLNAGRANLDFDRTLGYLPGVLKQFGIPLSSQTLVFSKTSSQADHTSPKTPRALYFNDDVYVGSVQDAPVS